MHALLHRSRHALTVSTLFVACGGGLAACGEDDKKTTSTAAAPATTPAAEASTSGPADAGDLREVIAAWFTAARTGATQAKCDLESEAYQVDQYGSAGQACLEDLANTQPQAAWAETVKIVSLDQAGEFATAVVQANAGGPAEATVSLKKEDAGWMISGFR